MKNLNFETLLRIQQSHDYTPTYVVVWEWEEYNVLDIRDITNQNSLTFYP